MTFLDKLFSFEGRLRRRDWWLLGIMLGLIEAVVVAIAVAVAGGGFGSVIGFNTHDWSPAVAVEGLIQLAFLWPFTALTVKRRHDRGASGVLFIAIQMGLMFLTFLPFNLLGMEGRGGTALLGVLGLVQLGVGVWFLVVLGFLDGTPGANRFGPSPKGLDMVDGAFD